MNRLIEHKRPYINNIREFLMVAKNFGFILFRNILVKKLFYHNNSEVTIQVNLHNGLISFEYAENNILDEMNFEDKKYLIKDFEHYVCWR